jgi:hypothetical protein
MNQAAGPSGLADAAGRLAGEVRYLLHEGAIAASAIAPTSFYGRTLGTPDCACALTLAGIAGPGISRRSSAVAAMALP